MIILRNAKWRQFLFVTLVVGMGFLMSHTAYAKNHATDTSEALASAEEAYQQVDFERVYEEASRALEVGGMNEKTTARIHFLIGIAATALGKEDDARRHFIVALAITPTTSLENGLSPRLRGPYLEAKGFWAAHQERIVLETSVDLAEMELSVNLLDPARLAQKVLVRYRKKDRNDFQTLELNADATKHTALPVELKEGGFEFFGLGVDSRGNILCGDGSEKKPKIVLPLVDAKRTRTIKAKSIRNSGPKHGSAALGVWPPMLAAGGLVVIGAGAVMNYRREGLADEWNSSKCESPGRTRLAQCESVNSERKLSERIAIGLYAGGGALFASGVVTWIVSTLRSSSVRERVSSKQQSVSCQAYVTDSIGAFCGGSF